MQTFGIPAVSPRTKRTKLNDDTMETKEYENDNPMTEASEPAAVYQVSSSTRATTDRSRSMTVDTNPPPCQYTDEQAVQRALQATAEAESGEGCLSLEAFEKLVEAW